MSDPQGQALLNDRGTAFALESAPCRVVAA